MHRHDRLGLRPHDIFECGGVEVAGVGLNIDEHRMRAAEFDRMGGGDMGHGRHHHLVAGADALREQRQMQAGGAGRHADRALDARAGGESLLESLGDRAVDELRARHDAGHRLDLGGVDHRLTEGDRGISHQIM